MTGHIDVKSYVLKKSTPSNHHFTPRAYRRIYVELRYIYILGHCHALRAAMRFPPAICIGALRAVRRLREFGSRQSAFLRPTK